MCAEMLQKPENSEPHIDSDISTLSVEDLRKEAFYMIRELERGITSLPNSDDPNERSRIDQLRSDAREAITELREIESRTTGITRGDLEKTIERAQEIRRDIPIEVNGPPQRDIPTF